MAGLLLLGAGGHAKVVAETALASGRFSRIAFLDDRCTGCEQLSNRLGWPVIGPFAAAFDPHVIKQFSAALVAVGNAKARLQLLPRLFSAGYELPVLIHPTAWVSAHAQIGAASVVFAKAVIQTDAVIGIGSILNTCCSVDHDAQLGDGVHICPGSHIAGEVHIGQRSWLGIGSSFVQKIHIGADVIVGAGAVVVRDLPDFVTAVGVPARVIQSKC